MTTLEKAYSDCFSGGKMAAKQEQGTCGIYSFWYASCLIGELNKEARRLPPPRAHGDKSVKSMRKRSKNLFHSAQGEILTAGEMKQLVESYGYKVTSAAKTADEKAKGGFITSSLAANSPVLMAYWAGHMAGGELGPVATSGLGAHWSLIIGENTNSYKFIEPNRPTALKTCFKTTCFASNKAVGAATTARFWDKTGGKNKAGGVTGTHAIKKIGDKLSDKPPSSTKVYDLGSDRIEELGDVLLAVSWAPRPSKD